MYIGERFEKNGKLIEVTAVCGTNYAFKEVKETKVDIPVFADEEEKPVVKRGRKKSS